MRPDSPRPLRRQHRGGTPVLVPGEASRRLQQRGDAAGGGEDRVCRRGSSDGDSCVREGRQQVSSSTGGLSSANSAVLNFKNLDIFRTPSKLSKFPDV